MVAAEAARPATTAAVLLSDDLRRPFLRQQYGCGVDSAAVLTARYGLPFGAALKRPTAAVVIALSLRWHRGVGDVTCSVMAMD